MDKNPKKIAQDNGNFFVHVFIAFSIVDILEGDSTVVGSYIIVCIFLHFFQGNNHDL